MEEVGRGGEISVFCEGGSENDDRNGGNETM
jgi:hypothetical protein